LKIYRQIGIASKEYFCVTTTPVLCERLFNSAGYIVHTTRSSLDRHTVKLCLSALGTGVADIKLAIHVSVN